jgi:hypothetical protein
LGPSRHSLGRDEKITALSRVRSGRAIGRADGDAVGKQTAVEFAATLRFRAY